MKSIEEQIERGIELLKLCQKLQSEKDGVNRPDFNQNGSFVIDKTKTLDQFAEDISEAATNFSALYKFFPMAKTLADLGRKLAADGKITVDYGDDYSEEVLKFLVAEHSSQ